MGAQHPRFKVRPSKVLVGMALWGNPQHSLQGLERDPSFGLGFGCGGPTTHLLGWELGVWGSPKCVPLPCTTTPPLHRLVWLPHLDPLSPGGTPLLVEYLGAPSPPALPRGPPRLGGCVPTHGSLGRPKIPSVPTPNAPNTTPPLEGRDPLETARPKVQETHHAMPKGGAGCTHGSLTSHAPHNPPNYVASNQWAPALHLGMVMGSQAPLFLFLWAQSSLLSSDLGTQRMWKGFKHNLWWQEWATKYVSPDIVQWLLPYNCARSWGLKRPSPSPLAIPTSVWGLGRCWERVVHPLCGSCKVEEKGGSSQVIAASPGVPSEMPPRVFPWV